MRRLRPSFNLVLLVAPAGLLLLLASLLVRRVWLYLNSGPRLAGVLSVEATRALGREVRVRSVRFKGNPWSLLPNRLEIGGLTVAGGPNGGSFVQADRIVIWYDLRQLLLSRDPRVPLVQGVELTRPQVAIARNAQGVWNFAQLIKPSAGAGRPVAARLSFRNGGVMYSDYDLPRPSGVPRIPFNTLIKDLTGVALIRPDKTVAFDVAGAGDPNLVHDFHVVGVTTPKPLLLTARITARDLGLTAIVRRLVSPATGNVEGGRADADLSLVYAPQPTAPTSRFDLAALDLNGTISLNHVTLASPRLTSPVTDLTGTVTVHGDSALGDLSAGFADARFSVSGEALDVIPRAPRASTQGSVEPTVTLRGKLIHGDWGKIVRASRMGTYLGRLNPRARADLLQAAGRGNLELRLVGPLNDPTAAVAGQVELVRYDRYRADNVQARAFYAHHTVDADARGRFAHGMAYVRAQVGADATGTFQIEMHGRDLQLSALRSMTGLRMGGTGRLDLAIQGENHVTPSITAQAEVNRLSYGGQTLRSVYAYAATVGDPLIQWGRFKPDTAERKKLRLETLRVDDARGFALGNGSLDLHTQQLNLNLEADELDLGALASAVRNGGRPTDPSKATRGETAPPSPVDAVQPGVADAQGAADDETQERGFDLKALQGVGYLRAHIGGTLRRPIVSGRVSAFAVQAGKAGLDTLAADFVLDRNTIAVDRATAERYPGSVSAHGFIRNLRSRDPQLDLIGRADNVDVADLLDVSGILPNTDTTTRARTPYVVTGRLFADPITVTGPLSNPVLAKPVTIRLESGAVNNLRLPSATLQATYDRAGLHIADAHADVAGGTVRATGTAGPRFLDVDITGTGLGLQSLATALPAGDGMPEPGGAKPPARALPLQPPELHGTLGFHAHVGGAPREPQFDGNATISDLGYRDFVLGRVQTSARFADGRFFVQDMRLRDAGATAGQPDVLQVDGFAYNTRTRALGGALRLNGFGLRRLGDLFTSTALADTPLGAQRSPEADSLAQSLQGSLSGTLTLAGTADAPTADITWDARDIKVKNQAITAITGSALVDAQHVQIPSPNHGGLNLRITSPEATIVGNDIRYGFDRVVDGKVVHGDIGGDLNAYNIDLAVVRNWLPPPARRPQPLVEVARQLTGKGDFVGCSVHGKTDSPVIDLFANFTNLDYKGFTIDRINLSRATIAEPQIQIEDIEVTKRLATGNANGPQFIAKVNNGKIGFQWKAPFLPQGGQFEIDADVPHQDLNALAAFGATTSSIGKPGVFAADTTGFFDAHAHVSRNKEDDWTTVGTLNLVADRLHLESARTALRNVSVHLDFARDIVTASGRAQSYVYDNNLPEPKRLGGEITLAGSLPLNARDDVPNGSAITLKASNIKIDETPIPGTAAPGGHGSGSLRAEVGLNLALRRSFSKPLITGDIDVNNTTVVQPRQFAGNGGGTFALPINPAFDMTINLKNNVRVVNSLLNARIDGTARLTGRLYKKTPDLAAIGNPATPNDATDLTDISAVKGAGAPETPDDETPAPSDNIGLNFRGDFTVRDGRLTLPTARFTLLPPGTAAPGTLSVRYPDFDPSLPGQQVLGFDVNVAAQTFLDLPTYTTYSGRKRYRVTAVARGRPVVDPVTGQSRLTLNFQTDPPDFTGNQQLLQQRLVNVLGGDALQGIGRNPGQVLTQQLTNVLTSAVIPGIFDRPANSLGFEELAINYDPVQRLNLIVSRRIIGPLYITYDRSFGGTYEMYNLKASIRFSPRYQLSYDTDDQRTQRVLLEGVLRF